MTSSVNPSSGHADRHVPAGLFWKARFFSATARAWVRLGQLESAILRDDIERGKVERPVYVAGVARSGTTIITEMLARHPDVTSHRYSDFPNVYTPFWRNWLADRVGRRDSAAVERSHRDRLMVTPESPEAVEEVIWMQFFDRLHDPTSNQVMGADVVNPPFERFYTEHIAKLLLVRGAHRYLAKGNYNVTRLGYLRKLFPEARFIVPIRDPLSHVASLVKQDRLFTAMSREDARVTPHLHRSGHFEFGPGKFCINVGDDESAAAIQEHWSAGRLAHGWSMYWNSVYESIARAIESDPGLSRAVLVVRYEDLCCDAARTISSIVDHADLRTECFEAVRDEYLQKLSEPDYYEHGFSRVEEEAIEDLTASAGRRFGYRA